MLKTPVLSALIHHLAILCLALASWPASALDLGTLHWKTSANQPPYAEIDLSDKARLEASAIRASLGSREAYAAAGLTYHPGLSMVRVTVQPGADGQAILKLEQLPQDAELLDLLVVVSSRPGIALAEYRVALQRGQQDLPPSPAGTLQLKARPTINAESGKNPSTMPSTVDSDVLATRKAIQAWAFAWSQRNVDDYIAAYSTDYPGAQAKLTRQAWLEQRRTLILARKRIIVELSDVHLKRQGDRVVATFVQQYRSDGPSDISRKRLVLAQENGRWLIQQETARPYEAPMAPNSTASQTEAPQIPDKDQGHGQGIAQ
jgi:hypothetical protein